MSLKDRKVDYNYIIYCYTVAKSPQPNQGKQCTVLPNIFYVLILSRAFNTYVVQGFFGFNKETGEILISFSMNAACDLGE